MGLVETLPPERTETAGADEPRALPYRTALLLWAGGLACLGLIFRGTLAYWYQVLADHPEESLGFAVPFVVAYMVWRRWDDLSWHPVIPSPRGGVAFIGAALLAAGCDLIWFGSGARLGLWLAVGGLTWAVWGDAWFRRLLVPFVMLSFAQPLPVTVESAVTHPLRLSVTEDAANLLSFIGVPTVAEGALLHLPNATLETTEACSGMRGFVAALAIALLLIDLLPTPRLNRMVLFPMALAVAYVLNIVRVMLEAGWVVALDGPSHPYVHTSMGLLTFAGVAGILALWQVQVNRRLVLSLH